MDQHENRRFLVVMMVLALMAAAAFVMAVTTGEPDSFPIETGRVL